MIVLCGELYLGFVDSNDSIVLFLVPVIFLGKERSKTFPSKKIYRSSLVSRMTGAFMQHLQKVCNHKIVSFKLLMSLHSLIEYKLFYSFLSHFVMNTIC